MGDRATGLIERLAAVQQRVTAAARGREVRLIAVSKRQPSWKVQAAYDAGQRDFGENHIQALVERRSDSGLLCPEARWHFIGRVQRNKAKDIREAWLVHGVGAERHARALSPARVLLQVNTGGEQQKNGFEPGDLQGVFPVLSKLEGLRIDGLMTLPPADEDPRPHFAALRELGERLGLAELSMGMSGDFEAAIEEGATMVRVGTAIFGPRED